MLRRTPLKTRSRDTGPNGATRIAVMQRDEECCVRCGVWMPLPFSIHHRLPRGQGGGNRLANLILLCGSATTGCHFYVERHRGEAYDRGWLVRRDADSAAVPVEYARRGLILLDNNGGWKTAA